MAKAPTAAGYDGSPAFLSPLAVTASGPSPEHFPRGFVPQLTVAERLKQLITALDARHVQPDRVTEAGIAASAKDMRAKAVARLAELGADEGSDAS